MSRTNRHNVIGTYVDITSLPKNRNDNKYIKYVLVKSEKTNAVGAEVRFNFETFNHFASFATSLVTIIIPNGCIVTDILSRPNGKPNPINLSDNLQSS